MKKSFITLGPVLSNYLFSLGFKPIQDHFQSFVSEKDREPAFAAMHGLPRLCGSRIAAIAGDYVCFGPIW